MNRIITMEEGTKASAPRLEFQKKFRLPKTEPVSL
jgi:hypothetical protein